MNFDLKKPCKDCPFRSDITFHLNTERVEEICDAITRKQQTFACHKTTQHDDETGDHIPHDKEQHCAGALILLERMNKPNQMMRIAERLRYYDRQALHMDAPVFETPEAMIAHFRALNDE
ncbi:hypothetical protein Bcep1808_7668 (plasmid) [Burkholderia vietnamiensis G4]|uniref:Uncharacterized protein n=1 Tax=Burkholderia vietnamiensis (strain G4 / LMG 22486) TaxID=269482 RepID=A4JW85_BURVG|nr:hypothetical protein Bcep1808_7668 [Burkholderia vietnamiensis G4]